MIVVQVRFLLNSSCVGFTVHSVLVAAVFPNLKRICLLRRPDLDVISTQLRKEQLLIGCYPRRENTHLLIPPSHK